MSARTRRGRAATTATARGSTTTATGATKSSVKTPAELVDEDGWPILEVASREDLTRAAEVLGPNVMYGNFIRAVLAGMYAERYR